MNALVTAPPCVCLNSAEHSKNEDLSLSLA
jgi:hypothetical protein